MFSFKYVHQDFEENLRTYKYVGTDKSLFYNYLLSPLGNFCVNYLIPENIAYLPFFFLRKTINFFFIYQAQHGKILIDFKPLNVKQITFLGLLCVVIPHLIYLVLFPFKFEGDVPAWLCIFTGIMHLLYMVIYKIMLLNGDGISSF